MKSVNMRYAISVGYPYECKGRRGDGGGDGVGDDCGKDCGGGDSGIFFFFGGGGDVKSSNL